MVSTDAWRAQNTVRYTFRVTNRSGIPAALQLMQKETGETPMEYARRVVGDALIRDGWLVIPEESKPKAEK